MDNQKKLNLAKAQKNVQEKKALEAEQLRQETEKTIEGFVSGLADVLGRGIKIDGIADVDSLVSRVEQYGQRISDFVSEISRCTAALPNLDELNLPETIELKSVTDDLLIETLKGLGNQDELIRKLQSLDQAVVLLAAALEKDEVKGQEPEDYTPVRIVLGRTGSLKFLEQWPVPTFSGGGGSGLTDAQLRASPVPVSASIDTTGLATETKQDDIITAIGNIGGSTNYTTRIATVGVLTYIGNAVIGSATSAAVWQIKRLDATAGLIKLWADGNDNYDNIWDNRASLSYS